MNSTTLKLPSRRLWLWRAGRRTGKVVLFTILCAGALNLNGMEPERTIRISDLPREVQSIIITHGDSLNDVIKSITKMSEVNTTFYKLVNDIYGNQKTFTTLVQVLAKKFNLDPHFVASQFKTPT